MSPVEIKAAIDAVHPALFPITMVAALWVTQWAVRRWAPQLWERTANWPFRAGLLDFDVAMRKVWQALPSVLGGAVLMWLASGGSLMELAAGAAFGALAPAWHELLKWLPGPYGSKRSP